MSTRNPMNERYQDETKPKGVTRKSAASAKPVKKAASSVHMETKSEPQKGFFGGKKNSSSGSKKNNGKKLDENPKRLQHPDTPEYKKWHTLWMIAIIIAVALTLIGLVARNLFDAGTVAIVMVVVGDVLLIAAVLVDVFKLSRMRTRYAQQLREDKSKATKRRRQQEAAARKEAIANDPRAQDLKAVREGKAIQAEKKKKSLNPFSTKNV